MSQARGPLAYAFWHWKRAEIPSELYEEKQRAFQAALAAAPPAGYLGGSTFRLASAPWAAGGETAYEDWYLVEDMAALERLNEAAVTATRQAPHDAVASLAAGGTAGLYGFRGGELAAVPGSASWFAKPAGMSYTALDELLRPVLAAGGSSLWSRRMTLGPTPEFCLRSGQAVVLPPELGARRIVLAPIWSGAR